MQLRPSSMQKSPRIVPGSDLLKHQQGAAASDRGCLERVVRRAAVTHHLLRPNNRLRAVEKPLPIGARGRRGMNARCQCRAERVVSWRRRRKKPRHCSAHS